MSYISDVNDLVKRFTDLGIPHDEARIFIRDAIIVGKGPEATILRILQDYNIAAIVSAPILADALLLGRRAQRYVEAGHYTLPDPPRPNGSGTREDQHA